MLVLLRMAVVFLAVSLLSVVEFMPHLGRADAGTSKHICGFGSTFSLPKFSSYVHRNNIR